MTARKLNTKENRQCVLKSSRLQSRPRAGKVVKKLYPLHKPLKEDQLTAVVEIAAMVAKELLHSASLVLADGTSLKITGGKVERKASSKYSESI